MTTAPAPGIYVDRDNGLVFGWSIVSEVDGAPFFNSKDTYTPSGRELLKAAMDYAIDGKGKVLLMHSGEPIGQLVYCFPVTDEICKAMGLASKLSGLMVAIKPNDATVLDQFESGELGGLSPHVYGQASSEEY